MRRALIAGALTLALTLGSGPADAVPAHTESQVNLLTAWFDVATFGPENNGVYQLRDRSVHYGYHYSEHCWYVGPLVSGQKYHLLYNIDVGVGHWLGPDAYCS